MRADPHCKAFLSIADHQKRALSLDSGLLVNWISRPLPHFTALRRIFRTADYRPAKLYSISWDLETVMAAVATESLPTTNGTSAPVANGANMTTTTGQGLSADEIALYDRQLRLWGAQAQERIRSAHILLVSLRALGTEIAKNLTLAGISSLTIIDAEPVAEEDLGAQYFLRESDVGSPVNIHRRLI